MKQSILFLLMMNFFFAACAQEKLEIMPNEELIFQSGFEPGSKVVARGNDADIVGKDNSLDENNGKYVMTIQPEGGEKIVVFDLTKITHNTSDKSPDGVSDFNPLKLYTSKKLIDFMHSQEKTLQIYWDDFKLWRSKRLE